MSKAQQFVQSTLLTKATGKINDDVKRDLDMDEPDLATARHIMGLDIDEEKNDS